MAEKITGQMDIGVYGMAVMGSNLALNMADHGFKVAAYNRTDGTGGKTGGHGD